MKFFFIKTVPNKQTIVCFDARWLTGCLYRYMTDTPRYTSTSYVLNPHNYRTVGLHFCGKAPSCPCCRISVTSVCTGKDGKLSWWSSNIHCTACTARAPSTLNRLTTTVSTSPPACKTSPSGISHTYSYTNGYISMYNWKWCVGVEKSSMLTDASLDPSVRPMGRRHQTVKGRRASSWHWPTLLPVSMRRESYWR